MKKVQREVFQTLGRRATVTEIAQTHILHLAG
nr:hypothetical protein [Nostoc sp. DedSLP05]MDZ8103595.1 hypothetical protein [Nostoc sp. DedSLP01]